MSKRAVTGFTLVELLVVIAIIAVLAAIILPAYFSIDRSQKLNSCMNNLRALGVALAMFREDYGIYPAAPPPEYLRSGGSDPAFLPFSSNAGLSFTPGDPALPQPERDARRSDLQIGGSYDGPPLKILVKIDGDGTPDSFTWSSTNGASWETSAPIQMTPAVPPALPGPLPVPLGALGITIAFQRDEAYDLDDTWTFWVGIDHVGQYGLATLYHLYLNDERDYVRSRTRYHCPAITATEQVDIRRNLATLWGMDSDNRTLRTFDPLWAGYNTYDATYNYDQYDSDIQAFDTALNFGPQHVGRTLKNPNAPTDTVVCWCFGHRRAPEMTYRVPVPGQPAVVGDAATARQALREGLGERDLVLWVDGTVDAVRPYLMEARDADPVTGKPAYFWVPPFLYTPEGGVR